MIPSDLSSKKKDGKNEIKERKKERKKERNNGEKERTT